jgi:hypothetical protein
MRKKIITSAIIVLVLFWGSSAFALSIDLDFSQSVIMPGDNFSIDVYVTGAFDPPFDPTPHALPLEVFAFGFDIVNTNPSVVAFQSAVVNSPPFLDESGFISDTDVAGSALSGITDNNFKLATLNFTALALGQSTLGIFSDISTFNEGLFYFLADFSQTIMDISTTESVSVTAVPVPATVMLFGSGLLGLAAIRRRVKKS